MNIKMENHFHCENVEYLATRGNININETNANLDSDEEDRKRDDDSTK